MMCITFLYVYAIVSEHDHLTGPVVSHVIKYAFKLQTTSA